MTESAINPDSASYPYLAVAQSEGLRYETVLLYVAYLEWKYGLEETTEDRGAGRAVAALKRECGPDRALYVRRARLIQDAMLREHARREAALAAEAASATASSVTKESGPKGRPRPAKGRAKSGPKGRKPATGSRPRGRRRS